MAMALTVNEQRVKLALQKKIERLLMSDLFGECAAEFGMIPDFTAELMTESAFNVLLAVQDTNHYRDNNPE